jgi:hypothetical protein
MTRPFSAALIATALFAGGSRQFPIYDNLFYKGKPDTVRGGLIVSNILYENLIWPREQNENVLPDRAAYEALARAHDISTLKHLCNRCSTF